MYSCIYVYMAIRTCIYADCLADLIVVHPFSVSYHGTACSLLRPLSLRLPLFLPDGGAKWRDCMMVSLTVHGRSLTAYPFTVISLPFFGSGSFAGTTSLTQVSGPGRGTVIFFPVRSSVFTDTGSGDSFLVLVSSFQLPFTSNHSWRSFHFSDKSDIHFPLQS